VKLSRSLSLRAFTRLDLLAVLVALTIVISLQGPALGHSREPGREAACRNNLRQLGQALLLYSADNEGLFPARASTPTRWPEQLRKYYGSTNRLVCPSDGPNPVTFGGLNTGDSVPRSYILNGWADYQLVEFGTWPSTKSVPESAIPKPEATIALGEKVTESGHFWFDYAPDDEAQLEQARHFSSASPGSRGGGSNYAFVDGRVDYLRYGYSLWPTNLWAVYDLYRNSSISP
jgi:prepilin-type processing-associated H-X9-DG protein